MKKRGKHGEPTDIHKPKGIQKLIQQTSNEREIRKLWVIEEEQCKSSSKKTFENKK